MCSATRFKISYSDKNGTAGGISWKARLASPLTAVLFERLFQSHCVRNLAMTLLRQMCDFFEAAVSLNGEGEMWLVQVELHRHSRLPFSVTVSCELHFVCIAVLLRLKKKTRSEKEEETWDCIVHEIDKRWWNDAKKWKKRSCLLAWIERADTTEKGKSSKREGAQRLAGRPKSIQIHLDSVNSATSLETGAIN